MKRLIVCSDGTWQDLKTDYPTNVVKLVQAVDNQGDGGLPQIVFYDAGIGTEGLKDKITGGAFGKGIDRNILDCYRFLILNYSPGDEVYLFGFSRGSYTVRSLAGLIYCSGLSKREHIRRIHEAYALYRDRSIHPDDRQAVDFRKNFGENIEIALLSCFDTVGSLGVPKKFLFSGRINKKYAFHDTKLNPRIRYALHAVSIDEPRRVFDVTLMTKNTRAPHQDLKQVWFTGDHIAVGGGSEQKAGLSDITLEWMLDSIKENGLRLKFDPSHIPSGIEGDYLCCFDNNVSFFYRLTGTISRNIASDFADIHQTVKQRWRDSDYRPKNLAERFKDELDSWDSGIKVELRNIILNSVG